MSVGRLDARGYDAHIWGGVFTLRDPEGLLLAKVYHDNSYLYVLKLNIASPVCLAASGGETAWWWHARFGHLNFQALRRLAQGNMVRELPAIDHVDQLCDWLSRGQTTVTPVPGGGQVQSTGGARTGAWRLVRANHACDTGC